MASSCVFAACDQHVRDQGGAVVDATFKCNVACERECLDEKRQEGKTEG